MKLETAKTLILIILIGTSLILTFGVWNYRAEVGTLSEDSYEEVSLGGTDDETKRSLIQPSEIIFKDQGEFYGFSEHESREQLYLQMQNWTLTDFRTQVASERTANEHEVEVIFPDPLPMELISRILSFSQDDIIMPGWTFDRMYITFQSDNNSLEVEFLSNDSDRIALATVTDSTVHEQLWSYITNIESDMFRKYTVFNNGEKDIYIPEGEVVLHEESLRYTTISPSSMRDILFPNPGVVMESTTPQMGLTYFTDSRQMRVGTDRYAMEYVNPFTENTNPLLSPVEILDKSIDHINNHSGWTGDYTLAELDVYQSRVKYRMNYEGYPVFSRSDPSNPELSTIEQKWNSQQLEEYQRPLVNLDDSLNQSEVELSSGESFIANLLTLADYNRDSIEDIKIGYRLRVLENNLIELEPNWYVKYNGTWRLPVFNEMTSQKGGD
ncbi:YycH family regulatory protein [Oceanobacillus damuensis]|uniref:YycH family regulatory protein n=1 Tax=Oceanobacillus damuensis TaxID=937928 RepID=UPI00082F792F|nr:two-component system activity regulator YycH [Oceanobacillus damuensis]